MALSFNHSEISSFCGDIAVLKLEGEGLEKRGVTWRAEGGVFLRRFDDFDTGVLAALTAAGPASVTAEYNGEKAVCRIDVRPMKHTEPSRDTGYYFGDFHSHTTSDHKRPTFLVRGDDSRPSNSMRQVRDEGFYDCFAVTDHGCLIDDREFFRLFEEAEAAATPDFIPFPGSESEVDEIEVDRFGVRHKNSGEIVTFNATGWSQSYSWAQYFRDTGGNPHAIACFAHPQILGYSVPGIWNFKLKEKTTPALLDRVHMVELGNGKDREANLINERVYSLALDCGYRIAPAMNGDSHGKIWGREALPGRTVLLAAEKSREAFIDAIESARVYATESGDVKLSFTVNGHKPASTLRRTNRYDFWVKWESFGADIPQTHLDVVSDGGRVVFSTELPADKNELTFRLNSDTARYFFLRLFDAEGRRTWSSPVWTGRAFDVLPELPPEGEEIDKSTITASVPQTINGDVNDPWTADAPEASLVYDFGRPVKLKAIGYYPHIPAGRKGELTIMQQNARFLDSALVSVSDDGESWKPAADILYRSYGGETITPLDVETRCVKLDVKSVGSVSRSPNYLNEPAVVGEISFYR